MRITVPSTKILLAAVFFLVALNVSAPRGLVALAAPREDPGEVDFEREIWPILSDHCIRCHGPDAQEGQLRLDGRLAAHRGGVSGTPFAEEVSESLLMERLTSEDPDERMPLDSPPLEQQQVELLAAWIKAGHPWPEHIGAKTSAKEDHWAYAKPSLPAFPATRRSMDAGNPIDLFVRERLTEEGLQSARPADPATLIRRLYLDLVGLPPPLEEVQRFTENPSPQAYQRIVDRLLSSSRFGEKWARAWLDLARYSDSNGYQADQLRDLWPYRDWVINALNADMAYDQFTLEQIAGDLLPGATMDQKIATGFHRTPTCNIEAGVDPEENRTNQVIDRVNTTATVWLGTTLECAQCHNHKYDPFTQRDYYRMFAFFNNTPLEVESARKGGVQFDFYGPRMELPTDASRKKRWHEIEIALEDARAKLAEGKQAAMSRYSAWEKKILTGGVEPDGTLSAARLKELKHWLMQDAGQRSESRAEQIKQAFFDSDPAVARIQRAIVDLERSRDAAEPETTLVMLELESPRMTRIFKRGDFLSPRQPVSAGVPQVLPPLPPDAPADRLGLATWLGNEENPLTARVRVNHLWKEIFGRGLVSTSEDFGTQGTPPSHPELLDWLAITFMQDDWSTKRLLRRIVTSETYQQASERTPEQERRDPKNILLARGPRFRLAAETIRDNGLAIAGLLEEKMGGPPIYPPQPDGLWHQTGRGEPVYREARSADRYRRGVYVVWRRVAPYPSFVNFDAPDRTRCIVERSRTNTPLQALTLLNDEAYIEMARGLATRIMKNEATADRDRLARAFRWCVSRSPDAEELDILESLLVDQRDSFKRSPQQALELAGFTKGAENTSAANREMLDKKSNLAETQEWAAWICVANALLNLDETINKE